ncbi:MAG TPA: VOC family protein [Patescibacteria group bacterium]|jgi:hypothetical protein|nr:VOC family protein [Patescibacteria group bacterium]
MNSVVHFELPVEDRDRASEFYSQAFGWKANKMDEKMGSYTVVQTAETDAAGMIQEPGRINGGLYMKTKEDQFPTVVIAVDDINEAMEKVKSAGGKILGGSFAPDKPDDIPGVGKYIAVRDTEGNRIALLQPNATMEVHA